MRLLSLGLFLALCGCVAATPSASNLEAGRGRAITLPGPQYEVLHSGPAGGAQPTRADSVAIRYIGRLTNGDVFSTSTDNGAGTSTFAVRTVIPGFSALVQLMRPGDRWRFTIPGYLAYGREGRRYGPGEATLKRDVPPDATLIFDVELVSIARTE
jgi:FKBP-type peptidyl-prolyl cis-trans isomerase